MNDDFEESPILQKLLSDLTNRAERLLREAVAREGKVLTGKLRDSIRAGAVTWGKGWISGHVSYSELLRIKDMKVLRYTTIPPLGPIERWVESVGVSRFAYVPGYPEGVEPATESEAITRIAKGVQYNLKAHPNVRRGYRGIYNDALNYSFVRPTKQTCGWPLRCWPVRSLPRLSASRPSSPCPTNRLTPAASRPPGTPAIQDFHANTLTNDRRRTGIGPSAENG